MNRYEAVIAMLDGKKVRGSNWETYEYIEYKNYCFIDESGEIYDLTEYVFDDWEAYEEEPLEKEITMYKYAYIESGMIKETVCFYEDIQAFDRDSGYSYEIHKPKRLDYTATKFTI